MTARAPSALLLPLAVATLGIATFSAMDAVMKGLAIGLGVYNALLWRWLAGAAIGGAIFFARRGARPSRAAMRLHLERGILGTAMAFLFFWGLARVPLAQGVALSFVAPLIALYLAALILKERIERRAILASLLGFAGVVVILFGRSSAAPGPEAMWGAVAILASALLYAYNIILMRKQALVAGPVEIGFFMQLIPFCCYALAAPLLAVPPDLGWSPWLVGAALLSLVSLFCLSWAYARAEAQYLAPVEYTAFVWALALGWLAFGEAVGPLTLVGAGMIVAACLIAARRRPPPVANVEAAL